MVSSNYMSFFDLANGVPFQLNLPFDTDRLISWIEQRQQSDGGFECGTSVNMSYTNDTFWACATLRWLQGQENIDLDKAIKFVTGNILSKGGIKNNPRKNIPVPWTAATGIMFLEMFDALEKIDTDLQIHYFRTAVIQSLKISSSSWDFYYSIIALKILNEDFDFLRELTEDQDLNQFLLKTNFIFSPIEKYANFISGKALSGHPITSAMIEKVNSTPEFQQFINTGTVIANNNPNLLLSLVGVELASIIQTEVIPANFLLKYIKNCQIADGGIAFNPAGKSWCGCAFYALNILQYLQK